MRKGVIIYLFDKDLSKFTNIKINRKMIDIEDISFDDFKSIVLSRDDVDKASMIIYISDKYKCQRVLKNIY